jgi:N-acetylmuramic acid 6-phosphate etherase
MLSTCAMAKRGRVYDNLMVGVVARNAKLRARAARLVRTIAAVSESRAEALLSAAEGDVRVACLMELRGLDAAAARERLAAAAGSLRAALAAH